MRRLISVLHRLYPRSFRARFGPELASASEARLVDQPGRRWRALADALVSVVLAWLEVVTSLHLGHDLRHAVRTLCRTPGFTLAAITTAGLGIAAFTIVYAVVDATLLRPLPFGDRNAHLITIHSTHPTQPRDWDDSNLSYAEVMDLRDQSQTLVGVEASLDRNFSVTTATDSIRVLGASVTPGLFRMLGVDPAVGRHFRQEDAAPPGLESTVIVSHSLWQQWLGRSPAVVGSTILLNARPVSVIGVMPEDFRFPEQAQLWLPYAGDRLNGRANRALTTFALRAPDASDKDVQAELDGIATRLADAFPATHRGWGFHALSFREFFVGAGRGLQTLLAAAFVVLLVTAANLAGLFVARSTSRTQELLTRAALGASRARVITLLSAEALLVALAGGAVGLLLARWGIAALLSTIPESPVYWATPVVDIRVVAAVLLAVIAVVLVAGLIPAWRLSGPTAGTIAAGARLTGSRTSHRLQRGLVVAQVAASAVLLVAASLLASSARALQTANAGFDPRPLLSARFYIAGDAYDDVVARAEVVNRVRSSVARLAGVTSVAVTQAIPADDGGPTIRVRRPGPDAMPLGVSAIATSPELWETLNVPLRQGRTFTANEHADPDAGAVLVNQRLASRLWPNESPVEKTLDLVAADGSVLRSLRVVGVAPDVVYEEFGEVSEQAELNLFVPYARQAGRTLAILARVNGEPASLSGDLRSAVRQVDPAFATFDVLPMQKRREVTMWGEALLSETFSRFAGVVLLLACLGTYALVSHVVAQRRREFGVRLAIGASPALIVRSVLGSAGATAVTGLIIGLPIAAAASRLIDSAGLLFETNVWTASMWLGMPLGLLLAVLVATVVPARRAGAIAPVDVLRE